MTGVDLSHLNESERSVLLLLAEGHTAKSIANLTGRSVGAVNERLREARRKTGIGSSRELARLVAQENRDEEIGIATAMTAPTEGEAPGAGQSGRLVITGLIVVLFIAIAAAAFLSPQDKTRPSDPEVDTILGQPASDEPREARDQFLAERRDDAWAGNVERAARARYMAIPGLAHDASLRVVCAATICQANGHSLPGGGDVRQNRVLGALDDAALIADFKILGLQSKITAVSTTKGPSGFAFVTYWVRRP